MCLTGCFVLKVETALVSVSDKSGIVDFAKGLSKLGVKLVSTGGTAKLLKENRIPYTSIEEYTGTPEMLDGRVKTLHWKVHAGLLALRMDANHMKELSKHNIPLIDMVVVNLYPFKKTIEKKGVRLEEAVEQIDVGGPTMIRAAAKNYSHVAVIVDPGKYLRILKELEENNCSLREQTLSGLAVEAFRHTAEYDSIIYDYLAGKILKQEKFPAVFNRPFLKRMDLRYGENSHQEAAFYAEPQVNEPCITSARQVAGEKQLSFNNILDLNSALELVKEFKEPTAVIIKHTNPCGVASSDSIQKAYEMSLGVDPLSAFGSIVALNRVVDGVLAEKMTSTFVEAVIAPSYTLQAIDAFKKKPKVRVLETGDLSSASRGGLDLKKVIGGLLLQDRDLREVTEEDLKVVSRRKPTEDEVKQMLFAWRVCRHTKSNSIILAKDGRTTGIGAGQMSRVDSVKIAVMKSNGESKGSVMASDAFFPFRDGIDEAAKGGITAVIHPGGSIRDEEVIKAADEHSMAMVFTGVRCFVH
ncbi:MAG: bifunctional phosphoribosylaminoimidazolecarboxamide formyltransferase/IMP cyclohydrolase [Candidatus Altiarchaeota archaeon]|nr:bifunctional phosphoribosylaminoimidazolecarboxamide formyltransferase/IMP cyclohydrolase [Candidatus Altiarchaeota archaeon]